MTDEDLLLLVELHLVGVFGHDSGRASVSFLGTEQIEILRFGPDPAGLMRYATIGMSRRPMTDPRAEVISEDGPRAELFLTLNQPVDDAFRSLAAIAASPAVEGVVLVPGAGLDLGEPLWEGSRFTAVLVGEPADVPDLEVEGHQPVRFFPLLPMTANEAAWKRVHGAEALEQRWLAQGRDLRDPDRPPADLT